MSYNICLEVIQLTEPHHMRGGTYQVGGTTDAWLNITYNYFSHFRRVLGPKGIRTLYGYSAEKTIPLLTEAIAQLKDDETDDYWEATEGNGRRVLLNLLNLANLCPHGIWRGD